MDMTVAAYQIWYAALISGSFGILKPSRERLFYPLVGSLTVGLARGWDLAAEHGG